MCGPENEKGSPENELAKLMVMAGNPSPQFAIKCTLRRYLFGTYLKLLLTGYPLNLLKKQEFNGGFELPTC